tara:strand:+ start:846 stop:1370 length:525 start_codon:yes stop_codon:yes gene_type:complete
MSNSFWGDPGLQPKRKSRFILNIGGLDSWLIKRVKKPSFEVNVSEHTYLNHKFYYPGTVTWKEVDCTLVDPLQPDSTRSFVDVLTKSGYRIPSSDQDINAVVSKSDATAAIGVISIKQINAQRDIIEEWKLQNAFVSNVDFGELSYEDDGLVDITVTFRYDYAQLVNSGKAANV